MFPINNSMDMMALALIGVICVALIFIAWKAS